MNTVFLGTSKDPNDPQVNEARLLHACKGNDQAKEFLMSYTAFSHVLDDLVDGVPVGAEKLTAALLSFLSQVLFNAWFEKHKAVLFPEMVRGTNAWCDSEITVNHEDPRIKRATDVLKSSHADIVFLVAYYIGGQEHMREVSKMWRTFDFDNQD